MTKPKKNQSYFLTIGSVLAYLITLALFSALVLSALYKQYYEISLSVAAVSCESFSKKLSRYAKFGIEPDRINGLEQEIINHQNNSGSYRIIILDKQKQIIAKYNYEQNSIHIPQKNNLLHGNLISFSEGDTTWLMSEIFGNNKDSLPVGYVLQGTNSSNFIQALENLLNDNLFYLLTISLGFLLLLIFLSQLFINSEKIQNHPKRKVFLYSFLLLPFIIAQIFFIFTLYEPIKNMQVNSISSMATKLSQEIADDIKKIQDLDIPLSFVADIKQYFQNIQENFLWVEGITIREPYYSMETVNDLIASEGTILQPNELTGQIFWKNSQDDVDSSITIFVSSSTIFETLLEIFLDIITVMVITFIMLMEFLNIVLLKEDHNKLHQSIGSIFDKVVIIRPIIFICMFAISLSISFIPLQMAEISPTVFGLSEDISIGLPVSVEMFCVGFAIMIGGFISHRIGWRPLLIWGCLFVGVGAFLSAIATYPITFILARCVAGLGYGSINLAAQLFVISKSSAQNRTTNIAFMVAGLCAGILCGSAFGGLIADRLNYSAVFFTAGTLMFITFFSLLFLLPKESNLVLLSENTFENTNSYKNINQFSENQSLVWKIFKFCTNLRMASLLFLHIMPCALITVCLFQFYIPVSLNAAGVSPAGIGRVSMFFSLMIVYLGPILAKYIDKSNNAVDISKQANRKAYWLCLAGFLAATSVAILSISDGMAMAILSVTLLGCCNAITYSAQGAYALELKASAIIGSERTISIYNIAERLGQVLGPIGLGLAISIWGATNSLQMLAVIFGIMTFLLLFSARPQKIDYNL